MSDTNFRADAHRLRIFGGADALANLPAELRRLNVRRALVFCGHSVARNSGLIARLQSLAGASIAAVFDRAGRHANVDVVQAAARLMRETGADGIVAVGAGSVLMAARLVAILHAENRPIEDMVTRYDGDAAAVSPRLLAPKVPIVNVLTAATNAQARAGSALRQAGVAQRLEMYDPKTRPSSIFWDRDALLTAPVSLARTSGLHTFWSCFNLIGAEPPGNPLADGDARQAFRLALGALPRMSDPADADARIDMCAAAYLHNRYEDSGGDLLGGLWFARVCYALGAGIFTRSDQIDGSLVYVALTGPAIAHFGERELPRLQRMVRALGVPPAEGAADPVARVRDAVQAFYAAQGFSPRLRDFGLRRDDLPALRDVALRNFNADRHRVLRHEVARLDATLADAW